MKPFGVWAAWSLGHVTAGFFWLVNLLLPGLMFRDWFMGFVFVFFALAVDLKPVLSGWTLGLESSLSSMTSPVPTTGSSLGGQYYTTSVHIVGIN